MEADNPGLEPAGALHSLPLLDHELVASLPAPLDGQGDAKVTREEVAKLIAFLQTRTYPHERFSMSGDLPDPAAIPFPTVTLRREQLARFRAQFADLHAFACAVTGAGVEELTMAHLMSWLWNRAYPSAPTLEEEKPR